ncbi:MAG: MbcA/ParS/Xre antitoxin family protein [Bryobacteraceae bacterium]|nr:MbcA/ParS/Xre antitoxin family protein [Bryobacteraceae bacterium]
MADSKTAEVIARAAEVLGNYKLAQRWMITPVRALNHATPISLAGSEESQRLVLDVLTRLEHGVL